MQQTFLSLLESSTRKQLTLAQLRQHWLSAHPEQLQHPERDTLLLTTLQNLAVEGHVKLPSTNSFAKLGNPPMPNFVTLVRAKKVVPVIAWDDAPWLPELGFWPNLNSSELTTAKAINDWLWRRQQKRRKNMPLLSVPLRERSLEIFGDEKFLDKKVHDNALFGGRLQLSTIDAFQVPHPLPYRKVNAPGKPVLVVENHHSFWSLANWNSSLLQYAAVIYGAGKTFHRCGLALQEALHECDAVGAQYFGDLDPVGVDIPLQFNRINEIQVAPAVNLYRFLLSNGIRRSPLAQKKDAKKIVERWLPELSIEISALWEDGQWIPQESLGTEQLFSSDGKQ